MRNNIMVDVAGSDASQTAFLRQSELNGTSDYNLFYGATWSADATPLFSGRSLAEWRNASGQDMNSVLDDPQLESTDPDQVHALFARPAENSPAVNSGADLPGNAVDFHGTLRGTAPDRGAVEYSLAPAPISGWQAYCAGGRSATRRK